jgi:uncharacterized protein YjbI with pentapeptide repeats
LNDIEKNDKRDPIGDEKRQWLTQGRPLKFVHRPNSDTEENRVKRTIRAEWLQELISDRAIPSAIDITNAIIQGHLDLKNLIFERQLKIENSEFLDECDFSFGTFQRSVSFKGSVFHKTSTFRGAHAKSDFQIAKARFDSDAHFVGLIVEGILTAEGTTFKDADFTSLNAKTVASFNPAASENNLVPTTFSGEACFHGATFGLAVGFRGAQFHGRTDFQGISVLHKIAFDSFEQNGIQIHTTLNNANFERCNILGEASFIGVSFSNSTSFQQAQIGNVDFSSNEKETTVFSGKANFSEARISGDILFQGVQFEEAVRFTRIRVDGLFILNPSLTNEEYLPTTFNNEVNFSSARFGADLHCSGTLFHKKALFTDTHVTGIALFNDFSKQGTNVRTTFNADANFSGSRFESDIHFSGCLFSDATFRGIQVKGSSLFSSKRRDANTCPAEFRGTVVFSQSEFHESVFFGGVIFNSAIFLRTTFRADAFFHEHATGAIASFKGDVTFISARWEGDAFFDGVSFLGKAYFSHAHFNSAAYFGPKKRGEIITPVRFAGDAIFTRIFVKNKADFTGVQFETNVRFEQSRIEQSLIFVPSRSPDADLLPVHFGGECDFSNVSIQQAALFTSAQFKKTANFSRMSVGTNALFDVSTYNEKVIPVRFCQKVDLTGARFRDNASFIGAKFESDAIFDSAQFEANALFHPYKDGAFSESVDFKGIAGFFNTIFKRHADFRGVHFRGLAEFRRTDITGIGLFAGAVFHSIATFKGARCDIAVFQEDLKERTWAVVRKGTPITVQQSTQFLGDIDLHGFSYERIYINWKETLNHLNPYDRQPYSQLEAVYRQTGDEQEADSVYLEKQKREGRILWAKVFRRNEYQTLSKAQALRELPRALADKCKEILFNYGIRPYRLIFLSTLILWFGTILFSMPGAVVPKDAKVEQNVTYKLDKYQAFNVSLHQFIPIVEITPGSHWVPSDNAMPLLGRVKLSFAGYATLHRLAGLILVPLGLVAFTGLLKQKSS